MASHGFRLVEETTRNADRDTNWAHGAGITRHHKATKGQISHARLEKSPRHMEMTKWFVTSWHNWSSGWSFQLHLRTRQILFWDISQATPDLADKSMISCRFVFAYVHPHSPHEKWLFGGDTHGTTWASGGKRSWKPSVWNHLREQPKRSQSPMNDKNLGEKTLRNESARLRWFYWLRHRGTRGTV